MLEHEMAVEQNGFHLREEAKLRLRWVQRVCTMPILGSVEMMHHAHEPVFRRNKVGVEDGNEFAVCSLHAVVAARRPCSHHGCCDEYRRSDVRARVALHHSGDLAVSSVESSSTWMSSLSVRIFHLADGVHQAVDDELLVEDGQLNGDAGKLGEVAGRPW